VWLGYHVILMPRQYVGHAARSISTFTSHSRTSWTRFLSVARATLIPGGQADDEQNAETEERASRYPRSHRREWSEHASQFELMVESHPVKSRVIISLDQSSEWNGRVYVAFFWI
jgi:hypothetical protein